MTDDATGTGCKVERVIAEYDLDGLGDELERRWSAPDGERSSLRDLARYFNERVLEAALEARGQQPIAESVGSMYRILTDDEANPSSRTRVERNLERAEIDVATLKDDFVSHQAVHTYLTEYRDATPPSSSDDPLKTAERAINRLQSRTAAVTETNLDRLARKAVIAERDVEVFVDVEVFCNECGTARTVSDYLREGGCSCGASV